MLQQRHLDRYADVLIWALRKARSKKFRAHETVLIRFGRRALPLAEVIYQKLIEAGLNPVPRIVLTAAMERSLYISGNEKQLTFIAPGTKPEAEGIQGSIYLHAPESLLHLKDADPASIATATVARKPIRDILDHREERGQFSWTLGLYPTPALAAEAGMGIEQYSQQVIKACYLNRRDPVNQWQEVYQQATFLKRKLNRLRVKEFHLTSANCDLTITPGQDRRWIGLSGHNIPSFELFLSPDWRGTQGIFYADQPSFRNGHRVEGVTLTFDGGRVVDVGAQKGAAFIRKQLAMDPGASQVGEFSLTDRRFSKIDRFMATTLYDENFGGRRGNCHIALGSSYSDAFDGDPRTLTPARKRKLGFNQSALHWDLVNTEAKTVIARLADDSEIVIYKNGLFQL